MSDEKGLKERLSAEFRAMTPLRKWETLCLQGLIGTNEPWIEDMRASLQADADTIARLEAEAAENTRELEECLEHKEQLHAENVALKALIGEMVEGISNRLELFSREAKRIEAESEGDESYAAGQVQGLRYAALALSALGAFEEARALIQKAKEMRDGQG